MRIESSIEKYNKCSPQYLKQAFLKIVTTENYPEHNIFDAYTIVVKQIWHLCSSSC